MRSTFAMVSCDTPAAFAISCWVLTFTEFCKPLTPCPCDKCKLLSALSAIIGFNRRASLARSYAGMFLRPLSMLRCRVAPLCSIRDELGRPPGFLLRPACLVSCRRGVDVNGAANNPRISPIYRTDKYFIYVNSWPVPCALNPQNTTLFCAFLRCPNWVMLGRLKLGWGNLAGRGGVVI